MSIGWKLLEYCYKVISSELLQEQVTSHLVLSSSLSRLLEPLGLCMNISPSTDPSRTSSTLHRVLVVVEWTILPTVEEKLRKIQVTY